MSAEPIPPAVMELPVDPEQVPPSPGLIEISDYCSQSGGGDQPPVIGGDDPAFPAELAPEQYRAIAVLCAGDGVSAAARAARVARSTIYSWQKTDARFIAALNLWQKQNRLDVETGIGALTGQAIKTISDAVASGNLQASLAVVRYIHALKPRSANSGFIAEELQYRGKRIAARVYKMRALPPPEPPKPAATPASTAAAETPEEKQQARAMVGAILAGLLNQKAGKA